MKHLFYYLMMAAAVLTVVSCGDDDDTSGGNTSTNVVNVNKNSASSSPYATNLEFPHLNSDNLLIIHSTATYGMTYALEWNTTLKSQRWTCYELYDDNSVANVSRWYANKGEEQYPQDPDLPQQYRFGTDPFYGSGYDHGHICPSADRLSSLEVNKQTFYLTNMMPQVNGFNAKVWANMESMVRAQDMKNGHLAWNAGEEKEKYFRDTLYICKGGTIEATADCPDAVLKTTDKGLLVPKYYFMAVLCVQQGQYKALGFWIEHKACNDSGNDLAKYVVNIDELEKKTGIDFFCNLPDEIENRVESESVDNIKKKWRFK